MMTVWERKWEEIAIMLYGEDAFKRSMGIYDILMSLEQNGFDYGKVIHVLDRVVNYSCEWENVSRAISAIRMASPENSMQLLAILYELLDAKKNLHKNTGELGIQAILQGKQCDHAAQQTCALGVILGIFQLANYLDIATSKKMPLVEAPTQLQVRQAIKGLIFSQRSQWKNCDNISQAEKESWESILSSAIKGWVRNKFHKQQRCLEVDEILDLAKTKRDNDPTFKLSKIGELILDQVSYARWGELSPIERAILLCNFRNILRSKMPSTGIVEPPTPPAEPQSEEELEECITIQKSQGVRSKSAAENYYGLGIAYKEMGMLEDAIQEFLKAFEEYYEPAKKADCLLLASICCYELAHKLCRQGRLKEAQTFAEKCLQLDPDFPNMKTFLLEIVAKQAHEAKTD